MSSDPRFQIELTVSATHPQLLDGLEQLVQLGLISDAQVRRIARQDLTCDVPLIPDSELAESLMTTTRQSQVLAAAPIAASTPTSTSIPSLPTPSLPTHWFARGLQAWMAELSVRWLLLLGVFLVVVSSAVLAASQWDAVPPVGQYGILFAYTLAFWGASLWTANNTALQLTHQMLALTTLLIIPVNFWVIDRFELFRSGAGLFVAIAAVIGLTEIARRLLQPHLNWRNATGAVGLVGLILPWLHLGWRLPSIPLVLTYLGAIATTLSLVWVDQQLPSSRVVTAESPPPLQRLTLPPTLWITLSSAVFLLVVRAVWAQRLPIEQFGLALALCGWLVAWLSRRQPQPLWTGIGFGLLILGRLVASPLFMSGQAVVISLLALGLLWDRLQRHGTPIYLLALWVTHLQILPPMWQLVPDGTRDWIIRVTTDWFGQPGMPMALLGVVLLPDLGLHLKVAQGFRRRNRPVLAQQTERLAMILAVCLTILSLGNPWLRSLNLTLSAMGLIVGQRYQRSSTVVIPYAIHLVTLSAIASWIQAFFPDLIVQDWAVILLAGCIGEWLLAGWVFRTPLWQTSAWCMGLILSSFSYVLIVLKLPLSWGWIWFLAPWTATVLAFRPGFALVNASVIYSTILLIVTPILSFDFPIPRLLGLVAATGMMVLNSRKLNHLLMAAIAVGFGVTFACTGLWMYLHDRSLTDTGEASTVYFNAIFIIAGILWGGRDWVRRQSSRWHQHYQKALGGWAMLLVHGHLLILTLIVAVGAATRSVDSVNWRQGFLLATVVGAGVIAYRIWQVLGNWGYWLLAWDIELASLMITLVIQRSPNLFGWSQLGLAILALGMGQFWARRTQQPYLSSWHWIPIAYGLVGSLNQLYNWNAWSGVETLIGAGIVFVIARRSPNLRWLTYPALGLITVGLYELLIYQLLQFPGGQPGDGLVVLSLLAALLAIAYRLLNPKLQTWLSLSRQSLLAIAHLHWGLANALIFAGVLSGLTISFQWVAIWATVLLAAYAIIQGRQFPAWVPVGVAQISIALSGGLHMTLPEAGLQAWGGAIAAVIAGSLCSLPWQRWGWQERYWHYSASILPGFALMMTLDQATIPTLLLVAGFYVWFAQRQSTIRVSYISVLIADWALLRLLRLYGWLSALSVISLVAASILYVVEVDPSLQAPNRAQQRHLLRLFAMTLIAIAALYESDGNFFKGLLAAGLGLALASLGIVRKVRAFLYGGTTLFCLKVLRQLWLFIADYSLVLWAIGIALGLLLIWIAATFEARRAETLALLQHWQEELGAWE
jgi:hypothetical protein